MFHQLDRNTSQRRILIQRIYIRMFYAEVGQRIPFLFSLLLSLILFSSLLHAIIIRRVIHSMQPNKIHLARPTTTATMISLAHEKAWNLIWSYTKTFIHMRMLYMVHVYAFTQYIKWNEFKYTSSIRWKCVLRVHGGLI